VSTAQLVAALAGGAAAGALLTALTSLFTGWLSRRHDHRRWLSDKRLATYADFGVALNAWQVAYREESVDMEAAIQKLTDERNLIELLAPHDTTALASAVTRRAYDCLIDMRTNGLKTDRSRAGMTAMLDLFTQLRALQHRDIQGGRTRRRLQRRPPDAAHRVTPS
jgi:hypothetical protein